MAEIIYGMFSHNFAETIIPEAEILKGKFNTTINFTSSNYSVILWSFMYSEVTHERF